MQKEETRRRLNKCSFPTFMGHEEMILPMLVIRSRLSNSENGLGQFEHCTNGDFRPNDLASTSAAGYLSGRRGTAGINVGKIFAALSPNDWESIPAIESALDALGHEYAFFLEKSERPLHDGFGHRCRFVARARLHDLHPSADLAKETEQSIPAKDVLAGFTRQYCRDSGLAYCAEVYGDYYGSSEFYRKFGDEEQFGTGYAIWLEADGIVRVWTRIIYTPK